MRKKKPNTTKRLSLDDLELLRHFIQSGHTTGWLSKRFKVSGSTVAYHRKQIAKSEAIDADIKRHEAEEAQGGTLETLDDDYQDAYTKSLEAENHQLINRVQALELETRMQKNKIYQLQEMISVYVMRENKLI